MADHQGDGLLADRRRQCRSGSIPFARISKHEIAHLSFKVVEVISGKSRHRIGSRLVACHRDETSYWIWANSDVTGIEKAMCCDLSTTMPLKEALAVRAAMNTAKQQRLRTLEST